MGTRGAVARRYQACYGALMEDRWHSSSLVVWGCHGAPRMSQCENVVGMCWLCAGEMTRGQRVEKWAGASFTGQSRVRIPSATHVCEPCVFVCSRTSPVLGRPPKEGKKLGGNFRNYSHLWNSESGYSNASKGEKPVILDFLMGHHPGAWLAAIADSGQKHVIPWTPVNPAGTRRGIVMFDEALVTLPDAHGWRLVTEAADLLTAGATKEEIAGGDYRAQTWLRCEGAVRAFETNWAHERRSAWFGLALWLSQRDEERVATRLAAEKEDRDRRKAEGKTQNAKRRGVAGNTRGAPRKPKRQPAEALGADTDQNALSHEDHGDSGGMVQPHLPQATTAAIEQLGLFGSD